MRSRKLATVLSLGLVSALALTGCAAAGPDPMPTTTNAPLYAELPANIKTAGKMVFAADSHPPYRVIASDGSVLGVEADFLKALQAQFGIPMVNEAAASLPVILTGITSGRYQATTGPVRDTADREKDYDVIVWATAVTSYLFLESNKAQYPDSGAVCGKSVAGVAGAITESELAKLNDWCVSKGKPKATFMPFADSNATFLAVKSGRADLAGTTDSGALDLMDQSPNTYNFVQQTAEQGAGLSATGMLVAKNSGLGPVMFKAVQNMFKNGSYTAMMKKWKLEAIAIKEPLMNTVANKTTPVQANKM